MPKVSVILPIYNMDPYLKECLDSIINQTLKDIEIICINDGSTDNSLNIIEEYARADSRIKLVNQENQGQGTARNNGIKIAKGEYIAFVDPDDVIAPEMYEEMLSAAEKKQVDVVYCDLEKFDKQKNIIGHSVLNKICKKNGIDILPDSTFKFEDIKPICLMKMPNYPVNKIYKRDFIIENNIFFGTQRRSQDKIFSLKVKVLSKNNYYIGKQYYKYRIYESSTSNARPVDAKSINDEIRAFCKQAGLMEDLEKQLNKFAGYMYAKEYEKLNIQQKNDYKKYAKDNLSDEQYKIFIKYCNSFENSPVTCKESKNTILQQIFSVKNDSKKKHKIVTLFGIKFKYRIKGDKI